MLAISPVLNAFSTCARFWHKSNILPRCFGRTDNFRLVPHVWHKSRDAAGKQNNMIGGTDKAHSYARMPCTRANGDVCAIRSRPVPPIKYFCLFSSSSSFPFVCAKVNRLVPKVWHKSKITGKRRVLRLVPESGTSHDHVGTGDIYVYRDQKSKRNIYVYNF